MANIVERWRLTWTFALTALGQDECDLVSGAMIGQRQRLARHRACSPPAMIAVSGSILLGTRCALGALGGQS